MLYKINLWMRRIGSVLLEFMELTGYPCKVTENFHNNLLNLVTLIS